MTKEDLDELGSDLYREYLLDHYKNPRNAGVLDPADIQHDGDNPTCGDMVQVFARVSPDQKIQEIKFKGQGCAISQAAASILYEQARGKTLAEIETLDRPAVEGLLGIKLRPSRIKCGTLALVVIKEGIQEYRSRGTTKKPLPGFARSRPPGA